MLKELREILVGNEYSYRELSEMLVNRGYEDICWFGNVDEILESESIIVADNEGENQIQIYFDVTVQNSEDEVAEASILKITSIDEL